MIDNWEKPTVSLEKLNFEISEVRLDVLYMPSGYISIIQSLTKESKLLVMSDYEMDEIEDEYKYSSNYFND